MKESTKALKQDDLFDSHSLFDRPPLSIKAVEIDDDAMKMFEKIQSPKDEMDVEDNPPTKAPRAVGMSRAESAKLNYIKEVKKRLAAKDSLSMLPSKKSKVDMTTVRKPKAANDGVAATLSPATGRIRMKVKEDSDVDDEEEFIDEDDE